jgi:prepilin-type N-terminal cleavage/methylation domain-containing protein
MLLLRKEGGQSLRARGFSLLELVFVVIVIAIIVAVAAPRLSNAAQRSRNTSVLATFGTIENAAEMYRAVNGKLPHDYGPGSTHAAFASYVDTSIFLKPTLLGGQWDWNNVVNSSGAPVSFWTTNGPNVSINLNPSPIARWTAFDRFADDGSLTTGKFTQVTTHLIRKVPRD